MSHGDIPTPAKSERASPLTAEAFGELMQSFRIGKRLVLAASGGIDSTVLAALLAQWSRLQSRSIELHALVVDHQIAKGSQDVARVAAERLSALGFRAQVLGGTGPASASGHAAARNFRYEQLTTACKELYCLELFLAHHADDQFETFLLRLGRGSGLTGLSAMQPKSQLGQLLLYRPLLSTSRAAIDATAGALGLDYYDDPANSDDSFARARIRGVTQELSQAGLDKAGVLASIDKLRLAQSFIATEVHKAVKKISFILDSTGYRTAVIANSDWHLLHGEIQRRVLEETLVLIGQDNGRDLTDPPIRRHKLDRLVEKLSNRDKNQEVKSTLNHCVIVKTATEITISREQNRRSLVLGFRD